MIRRTTWIILAIFVVLVGVAWYLQRNKPESTADTTPMPTAAQLLDIQETELANIRVEDGQGRVVELQRDPGSTWTLVQPQGQPVDQGKVEAAVSQLLSLTIVSSLDTPPGMEAMGLQQALYTLTLKLTDSRELKFFIGNPTPIGNGYYVRRDDGSVVVVSKFGIDSLVGLLDNPPVVDTPTPEPTIEATLPLSGTLPASPAATVLPP